MKRTLLIPTIAVLSLVLYFASAQEANAFGPNDGGEPGTWKFGEHRQEKLAENSELLGITVEQLEEKLETQTMREVFEDAEITHEQLHNRRQEQTSQRWAEEGIAQEDIDKRLGIMDEMFSFMESLREKYGEDVMGFMGGPKGFRAHF